MKPNTLIIRTAGTNCDRELAHAFQLAGADTHTLHLNELIEHPDRLETFDIVGFPGGFSYGDDISAGRIFANRLRHRLYEPLLAAIDRGVPMIGICNGFQVLVKLGLLPDPHASEQLVTLADNTLGRFIDKWTPMAADPASACVWTKGLDPFDLPIAHGEGRLAVRNDNVLQQLREQGQIALRYAPGHNPNGSADDIAGLCDPTGLVLGLMPHPERFVDPTQHPQWTRRGDKFLQAEAPGLTFFRNAVQHVQTPTNVNAG
ncbi:phosphoribosylformylglycinamidine synthase subunit PurQ [Phycisphaerales bacterium AB-hyl4]|uniref:Phosphoribosylformylglycinamidine synthase subunit PurQ n=1 Tax=Natronomicrosphaera hydrolytica TaxID=3242702 RepID=A0ABV4TZP5_9BACT